MRYAILSDIHGNLEALTAVLEALAAERVDRYLVLGDLVGYGADPSACLERLHTLGAVMVAGNHEAGCIGRLELDWFSDAARAALVWTRGQLSFGELDLLRRLPLTAVEEPFTPSHGGHPTCAGVEEWGGTPDGGSPQPRFSTPFQQVGTRSSRGTGFTLVHSTLTHPQRFEYLVEAGQALDTLSACRTLLCLVGHTHLPLVMDYDRAERRLLRTLTSTQELRDVVYDDRPDARRYLVNPGSVGQPRDGDPRAGVALIDTDATRIAIRRIPYDIAGAQRKIRQAGLPPFLADRLAQGR